MFFSEEAESMTDIPPCFVSLASIVERRGGPLKLAPIQVCKWFSVLVANVQIKNPVSKPPRVSYFHSILLTFSPK